MVFGEGVVPQVGHCHIGVTLVDSLKFSQALKNFVEFKVGHFQCFQSAKTKQCQNQSDLQTALTFY